MLLSLDSAMRTRLLSGALLTMPGMYLSLFAGRCSKAADSRALRSAPGVSPVAKPLSANPMVWREGKTA